MNNNLRRARSALLALGLVFGAAACGSDDEGAEDDTSSTAATDEAAEDTTEAPGDEEPAGGEPADEGAACEADPDNLSGSSTVLFTADTDGEANDADITAETTLTVAADGSSMDPASLTVGVNEVFGVLLEAGGSIDAAVIGCAGGQTLVPNVAVGFVITAAGTYPISLDIAGTELGTITVE